MTLILPNGMGIASARPATAGMMVKRHRSGSVMFLPLDARLARAQLSAIQAVKVTR